jgi:flagellar capping protein FliD
MGRISTGIGLVSGINSKDIIDQLMSLESRPKDLLQTRVDSTNQQRLAYTDL